MKKLALIIVLTVVGVLSGVHHMRMTTAEMESEFPSLASNGSGVGVAWMDGRDGNQEVYFRTADIDRESVGAEVRLTSSADWDDNPQLCWNGSGYGLSYIHESGSSFRLHFQRLDKDGQPMGEPATLESGKQMAKETRIFCTDVGYGIVYTVNSGSQGALYYQYMDAEGKPQGGAKRLTEAPGRFIAGALERTGGDLAVFYLDAASDAVNLLIIDPFGAPRWGPLQLNRPGTRAGLPAGAGTKDMLLAVWPQSEAGGGDVMAAAVSVTGEMIGEPYPLSPAGGERPSVAVTASPTGFGVAWFEVVSGTRTIMFRKLDLEGKPLEPAEALYKPRELQIVGHALDIVSDAQGYVIVRSEIVPPINTEIILTRVPK